MAKPSEEQIRARAYALWERAGSPASHSQDFWNRAERELNEEAGIDVSKEQASVKQPPLVPGTMAR